MTTRSNYTIGTYHDGRPLNIGDVVKCCHTGRTLWRVLTATKHDQRTNQRYVECEMVGLETQAPIEFETITLTFIEGRYNS